MARYVCDGLIVDTERAEKKFTEGTFFDGRNHISVATGSQWEHEVLYKTKKGRWFVERWSQWQGTQPSARLVDELEACRWLLANGYDPDDENFPEELREYVDEVVA